MAFWICPIYFIHYLPLAPVEGIEPPLTVLETAALPLRHTGINIHYQVDLEHYYQYTLDDDPMPEDSVYFRTLGKAPFYLLEHRFLHSIDGNQNSGLTFCQKLNPSYWQTSRHLRCRAWVYFLYRRRS